MLLMGPQVVFQSWGQVHINVSANNVQVICTPSIESDLVSEHDFLWFVNNCFVEEIDFLCQVEKIGLEYEKKMKVL
jgi:hypothetical protein